MKRIITAVFLLLTLFVCSCGQGMKYYPGMSAPDQPVQKNLNNGEQFIFRDYLIMPLAEFDIKAKVLSAKRYSSDLVPVDLALGWGPMSDDKVISAITVQQSDRWYRWYTDELPITQRQIETNSSNMHLIPADDEVEKQIKRARKGDTVEFYGYLVEAKGADGSYWRSSLTRGDTGNNACEVVWVIEFWIVPPEP